jgi:hypothetical protein
MESDADLQDLFAGPIFDLTMARRWPLPNNGSSRRSFRPLLCNVRGLFGLLTTTAHSQPVALQDRFPPVFSLSTLSIPADARRTASARS